MTKWDEGWGEDNQRLSKAIWIPALVFLMIIFAGYYYYNIERDKIDEACLSKVGKEYCVSLGKVLNDWVYTIYENKRFSCASNINMIYNFSDEIVEKCHIHRGIFK